MQKYENYQYQTKANIRIFFSGNNSELIAFRFQKMGNKFKIFVCFSLKSYVLQRRGLTSFYKP